MAMLCVISWCSGLELFCCASGWVLLLYWLCCTQAWGSTWAFGRVSRSKSINCFFQWCLVTPFISYGKHCPCVPLVIKTLLTARAAEAQLQCSQPDLRLQTEPLLSLELHKLVHLNLLPCTAASRCHHAVMSLDFMGLIPLPSLWQESQKLRVKRGMGQEGKIVA